MPKIGGDMGAINGVALKHSLPAETSESALNATQALVDALQHCIHPYAYGYDTQSGFRRVRLSDAFIAPVGRFVVSSLHISPAVTGRADAPTSAIDITRINDLRIAEHYPRSAPLQQIVMTLQWRFEQFEGARRENYGPYRLLKSGEPLPGAASGDLARLAERCRTHIRLSSS